MRVDVGGGGGEYCQLGCRLFTLVFFVLPLDWQAPKKGWEEAGAKVGKRERGQSSRSETLKHQRERHYPERTRNQNTQNRVNKHTLDQNRSLNV